MPEAPNERVSGNPTTIHAPGNEFVVPITRPQELNQKDVRGKPARTNESIVVHSSAAARLTSHVSTVTQSMSCQLTSAWARLRCIRGMKIDTSPSFRQKHIAYRKAIWSPPQSDQPINDAMTAIHASGPNTKYAHTGIFIG